MIYLGIDPGKQGALWMDNGRSLPNSQRFCDMPDDLADLADEIDKMVYDAMGCQLDYLDPTDFFAVIEEPLPHVANRKAQNVAKQFTDYGRILGTLDALGIEYQTVKAVTWQAKLLKGVFGKDTKHKALEWARLNGADTADFYGPRGGVKDGRVDGFCLCQYAKSVATTKG